MPSEPTKDPFVEQAAAESQKPQSTQQRSYLFRLYNTPWRDLSAGQIAVRITIAILLGAVIGVIVGVIIRFA